MDEHSTDPDEEAAIEKVLAQAPRLSADDKRRIARLLAGIHDRPLRDAS